MWKRKTVTCGGVDEQALVNLEGYSPGIPSTLEWPVAVPVNTVFAIDGVDWFAASGRSCAGAVHIVLSATALYVAPPEEPRAAAVTDNVIPLKEEATDVVAEAEVIAEPVDMKSKKKGTGK